ncbi:MAG: hypothetical protein AB7F22_21765 [Reyranella sp.]|uniref:hypothetical protein n=1 Tax=Reyranella sp. TaxID=1929291 RepID=UPI003D0A7E0E
MARHAGVTAFCTVAHARQKANPAVPSTGCTSDDTSRKRAPPWCSGSTADAPQTWHAMQDIPDFLYAGSSY